MAIQTINLPTVIRTTGEIIAVGVSEEEYMERYAEYHCEWVDGIVIKKPPISLKHLNIVDLIRNLLSAYFSLRPIGLVVGDPFVMRLNDKRREPDLQIILGDNLQNLKDTFMDGPADICIEVVSQGSVIVDYGEKLQEYEQGGVGEYWLFDPIREVAHFHRMTAKGMYEHHTADAEGNYATPKLPDLTLHVPTLWQDKLPDYGAVWQMVQAMVGQS